MKDETRNLIDEYFTRVREAEQRAKDAENARLKREEDGVIAFLQQIETVILPTMTELAEYVTKQGVKAVVTQTGPKKNDRGIVMAHGVEVSFPESMKPGVTEPPHFKMTYNKVEQIVTLFRRTNDYNLPGERMTPDKITRDYLEEEFTKYFTKGL